MTDQRCRTCKYWGDAEDKELAPPDEARTCVRVGAVQDADESDVTKREPMLAYTLDGSGYYSALITYPEFGCVLWETET